MLSPFSSVSQFSCSVVSDSLRPHGLQHARLPCLSPSPRACSNSCPSSQWCHPTISSSVVPFFPNESVLHIRWPKYCHFSHVQLCVTIWTAACQAPLSMRFSRQEYWSELPLPSPGDLPNPGIELTSPALVGRFFFSEPPGKPQ